MPPDPSVKNLIFDLGGVILNLSVANTLQSFSSVSGHSTQDVKERFFSSSGFGQYEKGLLTDAEFRDFVREVYSIKVNDDTIDQCWNAMLLGIPLANLELLNRLKKKYNVYLLSNTNNIHLNYIQTKLMPAHGENVLLDDYFHRAYYSHLMKKRKPDAEIFEQVLEENGLKADESLFLDDLEANITSAKALGIKTLHVPTSDHILTYFHV
ncbi:MAG TPA: HAD family phosphatase [Chryseolinea sp.]|mgnify:CR=1 FL=1|nr:HAD family phosphatase [Chryseolinea sp.]HPM29574.1 HAD family phosphatase [Chryseolinea sp.]